MIALALQQAVGAALLADADLVAALGGPHVYDTPPRDAAFPFIRLAEASETDWSSVTERGAELRLTVEIWSRAADKREAWRLAGMLMRILDDPPLALSGARLILLRVASAEVRAEADGQTERAILRLVALAEA